MKTTLLAAVLLISVSAACAQTTFTAIGVPAGTPGNQTQGNNWTVGFDFYVTQPITVSQLGAFDDQSDGIQGSATLTAQLYARSGNSGTLLETLSFDAASPGALVGGNRFKPLALPVTLLPGSYSLLVYGLGQSNRYCDTGLEPYLGSVPWTLNDGGGAIQFERGRHGRVAVNVFPHGVDTNRLDHYVAGTFVFSPATMPAPPHAADYATLTAGVRNFHVGYQRRIGSLALFNRTSFPVLVEPGGNRLVLEAAGRYNDDPNGARCVAFTHWQWGQSEDERMTLFENAIQWASRKNNPSDIVLGVGPWLNASYFQGRGYQVRPIAAHMGSNSLPVCDVVAVNWHAGFDDATAAQLAAFAAGGGGLVVTVSPWELLHEVIQPSFGQVNTLLQPFGLAYRPSTTIPTDLRFTNIQAQPYPVHFSAYPAAAALGQDHLGQTRLTSLERVIALNAINAAVNSRPDLLSELTALSSGITNAAAPPPANMPSNFVDVVVLTGAQATTNRIGLWAQIGNDLYAMNRRGAVEYAFTLPSADVYQLQIQGTQLVPNSLHNDFDLLLSVDGVRLGHHHLIAGYGTNGVAQCLTPYLLAGPHTLRIFWDNPTPDTHLRLQAVQVQTGPGPDSDGNGIKDWVEQLVRSQSGLDLTNGTLRSYVSPICLEGRDPYPSLIQTSVQGANVGVPQVRLAPNGRWYANAWLSSDQNTPLVLNVSYQNGAVSEWRQIQWTPLNLLTTTNVNWTLRKGDALLLTARPLQGSNAPVILTVGTNQRSTTAMSPLPFRFTNSGVFAVTGTYNPGAAGQTRSVIVQVVDYQFPNNPDAWALHERGWDLTNPPPVVAFEPDSRIIFEPTAALTDGQRMGLITDESEPRYVLARLGVAGPVLDSARVNSFEFWQGAITMPHVVQVYPDGSQLVEMPLVLNPVPSDVTMTLYSFAGGVTFDDGTVVKTVSAPDFDAGGMYVARFIRPASCLTAVCHTIKLYQGSTLIGYVR